MEARGRSRRAAWESASPGCRLRGYTIVELVVVLGVLGTLASVALVNYIGYVEKARVARSIAEIKSMSRVLDALFMQGEEELPDTLAEVQLDRMFDPWGSAYEYLKIEGGLPRMGGTPFLPPVAAPGKSGGEDRGAPVIAQARKDQFLVPINSDYDLYSRGSDGESKPSLNTKVSRDDIIRARDGAYVGVAEDF